MAYHLVEINSEILAATEKAWQEEIAQAGDAYSPSGYNGFLASATLYLNGQFSKLEHTEKQFYALIDKHNSGNAALVLMEINYCQPKKPKSWLKIMQVRTSPRFDSRAPDSEQNPRIQRTIDVSKLLSEAITQIIPMCSSSFNCKQVKIWGNKQADKTFFSQFSANLKKLKRFQGISFTFDIDAYGNWLDIKW